VRKKEERERERERGGGAGRGEGGREKRSGMKRGAVQARTDFPLRCYSLLLSLLSPSVLCLWSVLSRARARQWKTCKLEIFRASSSP